MKRQRGATLIGTLLMLMPAAICLYAAIRLTPIYIKYMDISKSLEAVRGQLSGQHINAKSIREAIARDFEIDSVNYPSAKDMRISHVNGHWRVEAAYYDYAPLFANMSIQLKFDKVVTIP